MSCILGTLKEEGAGEGDYSANAAAGASRVRI